jgi:AcrR family transcriptional regulator
MGNREDLLAGARRCLIEKGFGRTTVRDISAAAGGVSMAAIGYHFGSREELLNAALIDAMNELSDEIAAGLAELGADATPAQRYQALWQRMTDSFRQHRTLWLANLEALVQAEHSPQLRDQLVAGQRQGRRGLAAGLLGVAEDTVDDTALRSVGSLQLALLLGSATQWLTDPDQAPTGDDLRTGLRTVAELLG